MFTKWIFPDFWQIMVLTFSTVVHQRSAWRLGIIFTAMLFAKNRKTLQAGIVVVNRLRKDAVLYGEVK